LAGTCIQDLFGMDMEQHEFVASMTEDERASVFRAPTWIKTLLGTVLAISLIWCQNYKTFFLPLMLQTNQIKRGARYLMGENLKVVWAEFSTLS
jgi:hypothetical protein